MFPARNLQRREDPPGAASAPSVVVPAAPVLVFGVDGLPAEATTTAASNNQYHPSSTPAVDSASSYYIPATNVNDDPTLAVVLPCPTTTTTTSTTTSFATAPSADSADPEQAPPLTTSTVPFDTSRPKTQDSPRNKKRLLLVAVLGVVFAVVVVGSSVAVLARGNSGGGSDDSSGNGSDRDSVVLATVAPTVDAVRFSDVTLLRAVREYFDVDFDWDQAAHSYMTEKKIWAAYNEKLATGAGAEKYGSIEDWDVGAVTSFEGLFHDESNSRSKRPSLRGIDLSKWNTSSALSMKSLFKGQKYFNGNLPWNTSTVRDFDSMFEGAKSFQGHGLSQWNTESAVSMERTFKNAISFNADISKWNTRKVHSFREMFYNATSFSQNLCQWDEKDPSTDRIYHFETFWYTSCPSIDYNSYAIQGYRQWCYDCFWDSGNTAFPQPETSVPTTVPTPVGVYKKFETGEELQRAVDDYVRDSGFEGVYKTYGPIEHWQVGLVKDFSFLFAMTRSPLADMFSWTVDLGNWDMSSATTIQGIFQGSHYGGVQPMNLSRWNTSNIVDFSWAFSASQYVGEDLSGWDTSRALTMRATFAECFTCAPKGLGSWNTNSVSDFHLMFYNTGPMSSEMDLSTWNMQSAKYLTSMFEGTQARLAWDFSGWQIGSVLSFDSMFSGATNFEENLCAWKTRVLNNPTRNNMFLATACPIEFDVFDSWCYKCDSSATTSPPYIGSTAWPQGTQANDPAIGYETNAPTEMSFSYYTYAPTELSFSYYTYAPTSMASERSSLVTGMVPREDVGSAVIQMPPP